MDTLCPMSDVNAILDGLTNLVEKLARTVEIINQERLREREIAAGLALAVKINLSAQQQERMPGLRAAVVRWEQESLKG